MLISAPALISLLFALQAAAAPIAAAPAKAFVSVVAAPVAASASAVAAAAPVAASASAVVASPAVDADLELRAGDNVHPYFGPRDLQDGVHWLYPSLRV